MNSAYGRWKIGGFEFDEQSQCLRRGKKEHYLGPNEARLLVLLIKNHGSPPRNTGDLVRAIWGPGGNEGSLYKSIQKGAPLMSPPSELLPVSQYVFQAMTKTNVGFEKLIANLEALQHISFFPSGKLADYANVICRIRSEINLLLVEVVSDRETSNALYYDRLCSQREKELTDPDDVLFDAEQRKKEIEEEQRKQEQEQKPTGPEKTT